ncbi:hypothetical protein [Aliikangiella sp. IMCC44359]|uniref:hypothetical protein n=1 Tax=Aliikangiella sp. IMCC44359 TaxID=3459125 RepID=UPI00403AFCE3
MKKTAVYLDHNILDSILKSRVSNLSDHFRDEEIVYVYSSENLVEIRKSVGFEGRLLAILKDLNAMYLFVEHDLHGRPTGKYEFRDGDPLDFYLDLDNARSETTDSNFGFDEIIQKLYGGASDKSYSEITQQGIQDIFYELDEALEGIRDEVDHVRFDIIKSHFSDLKDEIKSRFQNMGYIFDIETSKNNYTTWEDGIGIGPKELNNIKPPRVVEKVWEAVSDKLPGEVTFEKMFGLGPIYEGALSPRNNIDKCNAIYHALNFFGYYRDKGMKKLRRVRASSCDMTHAGNASLCDVLLSGDKDFCIKAQAAYEFLNINTKIIDVSKEINLHGVS